MDCVPDGPTSNEGCQRTSDLAPAAEIIFYIAGSIMIFCLSVYYFKKYQVRKRPHAHFSVREIVIVIALLLPCMIGNALSVAVFGKVDVTTEAKSETEKAALGLTMIGSISLICMIFVMISFIPHLTDCVKLTEEEKIDMHNDEEEESENDDEETSNPCHGDVDYPDLVVDEKAMEIFRGLYIPIVLAGVFLMCSSIIFMIISFNHQQYAQGSSAKNTNTDRPCRVRLPLAHEDQNLCPGRIIPQGKTSLREARSVSHCYCKKCKKDGERDIGACPDMKFTYARLK